MQLPKDLLNLVFLELDDGKDMLNFSEISRRCNQIFSLEITVIHYKQIYGYDKSKMVNNECQFHGLYRWWYSNGILGLERNYVRDEQIGLSRRWTWGGILVLD